MSVRAIQDLAAPAMEAVRAEHPRRILFLSPAAQIGGAEHSLLGLVKGLNRSRYVPHLVCFGKGPLVERCASAGIAWAALGLGPRLERLSLRADRTGLASLVGAIPCAMALARQVRRYIQQHNIALVHTNGTKAHVVGALAIRKTRIPLVWHVRDFFREGVIEQVIAALGRRYATAILTNSGAVSDGMVSLGLGQDRIRVVHNGVDLTRFSPGASPSDLSPLGWAPGSPVVGLFAMLAPWKGQLLFIEAAQRVLKLIPRAFFLIVGDEIYRTRGSGGFANQVEQAIRDAGLAGRVIRAGYREDIPELLRAVDVVVHASVEPEPFGRILIEAMACERPVIAALGGGVPEIVVDGETGVLVPRNDPEALAKATVRLLEDPALRYRMGKAGRARAEQSFDVKDHVRSIESLYDEILSP